MSARSDQDLFDPAVAAWLAQAAAEVDVDVDYEWIRLVDRIRQEVSELTDTAPSVERPTLSTKNGAGWRLLAVAAAVIALLALTGPVVVRTTVTVVNFVQEVVEPPVVSTTSTVVLSPITAPPTTITAPPTTASTTASTTDLAHAPILDGDQYRLTLRQVHDQINAAIGFGREDYAALEGADTLVEGLLGQRPEYDAELRDTIGHLRQALRARDRRAASAAHTIIDRIQRETAGG